MKKSLLLLALLPLFFSCTKNKIVGTWQEQESDLGPLSDLGMNIISKNTYSANGDYVSKQEWKHVNGKHESVFGELKGTWEMVDDNHIRVKTTTAISEEGERENITDNTYTILRLDDEELILKSKSFTQRFCRVK